MANTLAYYAEKLAQVQLPQKCRNLQTQTGRQTDSQTYIMIGKQADRQTDKSLTRRDKQKDRQTGIQ